MGGEILARYVKEVEKIETVKRKAETEKLWRQYQIMGRRKGIRGRGEEGREEVGEEMNKEAKRRKKKKASGRKKKRWRRWRRRKRGRGKEQWDQE